MGRRTNLRRGRTFCAAAIVLAAAVAGRARAAGLADGVSAAAADARVALVGNAAVAPVGDRVGGHDTARPAWVVGRDGSVAFTLRVPTGVPLTLEFEEMYGRDLGVRGYSVAVDGADVYFRTFRGSGAGPVHYFVQVPPQSKPEVEVRLTNRHDVPFAVSRAWAFADLPAHVRAAGMEVPYRFAPTVRLTDDFEADLAKLHTIRDAMKASPHAQPAWTTWLPYANLSVRDARERIDYALRLAEAARMPVQVSFDGWWANSPTGLDGRGGYWNDVSYQQVVYDNTAGAFRLSIPNAWGSTPWQTMNDAALNAYRAERLTRAAAHLRDRAGAMRAAVGGFDPILSVNLDNEPVYWASGNAGLGGSELFADFNAKAVADAKRDGVALDPTDGLSRGERLWLFGNILRYVTHAADAVGAGLAGEAIVVDGDGARPPADPLAGSVYTQGFVADPTMQFPLADATQGLWETAAPANARVGGEYNGRSRVEAEAIAHHVALGRSAAVNAEAGRKATEVDAVLPAYAYGLRYWAPYNYPLEGLGTAVAELGDVARPLPEALYERRLIEHDFQDGEAWRSQVAASGGARVVLLGNTLARVLAPTSADAPGFVVYRLDAPAGGTFDGLTIEFSGRAFVSKRKDPEVQIRVLAGDAPEADAMREAGRVADDGDVNAVHRLDLGDVARGKSRVFVRVELHAPRLAGETLSWCALRRVAFTVPWPRERTGGLPAQDRSAATLRMQNLIVSWRADAELAIERLAAKLKDAPADAAMWQGDPRVAPPAKLAAARADYDAGRYADAYRAASEGAAFALPATFVVRAAGPLGPYPLRVEAAAPVRCEIVAWDEAALRLTLRAEGDAAVDARLTIDKLPANARYAQEATPGGGLVLRRDDASGTFAADAGGVLHLTVQAPAAPRDVSPDRVDGVFHSADVRAGRMLVARSDGDGLSRVRVGASTTYTLADAGAPEASPRPAELREVARGDRVDVDVGPDGVARAVRVERRTLRGKVRAVRQLSTTEMAAIWLEGDDAEHVIELFAVLHLPGGDKTVRGEPLGGVGLAPGDEVRVRLSPVNGRVAELWK